MELERLEKAYFYNCSQRDIVSDISWLIEKLYIKDNRILVFCADQETVEIIDDYLWTFKDDGFIPHTIKKSNNDLVYPIFITTRISEEHNHNVLLVLNGALIREQQWKKFSKVYYFFDNQDKKENENARYMWKRFYSLNVVCKYWINKKNKWVLANKS